VDTGDVNRERAESFPRLPAEAELLLRWQVT
jgi:hypothetical protein